MTGFFGHPTLIPLMLLQQPSLRGGNATRDRTCWSRSQFKDDDSRIGAYSAIDVGAASLLSISSAARIRQLCGAVGLLVLVCLLTGCGRGASQRQAVLDAFVAPVEWVEQTAPAMSGEQREGLCIGPIDCQVSLVIQWRVSEKPSLTFLQAAARAAGWERIEFDRACEDDGDYCHLHAEDGDNIITLGHRPNSGSWLVRLKVE